MMLTLAESSAGWASSTFLLHGQHHVELGLQHPAGVDVGDVDGPAVACDVVDHGFGRTWLEGPSGRWWTAALGSVGSGKTGYGRA